MSMLLTAQAMKLKVGNPTRKLVLLKLADNANDKGECFPSYQHIADHCEVSRRSVISHIDVLIKMGLVEKKLRKNQDGSSSNLYILHLEKGSENISPPSERISPPSENGSLPPSENISPITNHSINQSINHNTNLTVSNARTKKTSEFDLLEQFGIEGDLATDFVKHRKACKAPITKTALTGFKREAEKAGISIQQAVTIAIERGWSTSSMNPERACCSCHSVDTMAVPSTAPGILFPSRCALNADSGCASSPTTQHQ